MTESGFLVLTCASVKMFTVCIFQVKRTHTAVIYAMVYRKVMFAMSKKKMFKEIRNIIMILVT